MSIRSRRLLIALTVAAVAVGFSPGITQAAPVLGGGSPVSVASLSVNGTADPLRRLSLSGSGSGDPGESGSVGQLAGDVRGCLLAEVLSFADSEIRRYPRLNLDAKAAPGPAAAGVRVHDAGNFPGGGFGGGDNSGVDGIGQAAYHIDGDLVADMADKRGYGDACDGITPALAGRYGDQSCESAG